MIRAYCLLGAAAILCNGPTLSPLLVRYQALMATPEPASKTAASPAAYVVKAEKDDDGLFRVGGIADDHALTFIVDTGATTTVLSRRDAATLGLAPAGHDRTTVVRTASGSASMTWKRIARLDVAGSHIDDLDVAVVEQGLDHSLLGQDVLSRLGTVTQTGNRLEIRPPRS